MKDMSLPKRNELWSIKLYCLYSITSLPNYSLTHLLSKVVAILSYNPTNRPMGIEVDGTLIKGGVSYPYNWSFKNL